MRRRIIIPVVFSCRSFFSFLHFGFNWKSIILRRKRLLFILWTLRRLEILSLLLTMHMFLKRRMCKDLRNSICINLYFNAYNTRQLNWIKLKYNVMTRTARISSFKDSSSEVLKIFFFLLIFFPGKIYVPWTSFLWDEKQH